MLRRLKIDIRKATTTEDPVIAQHFYQMWRDIGLSPESIKSDWFETTIGFIDRARKHLSYEAFIAEVEGKIVGSTSCQLFAGLYPNILAVEYRQYGYIWGVYVEASYRHQGIGGKLVEEAIAYLKSLNCTHAVLHAAPLAKPLYTNLGFAESNSNEMRLEL